MFSTMPSTTSVFSTYTTFAASAMLVKTVLNELQTITSQLLPQKLQEKLLSGLDFLVKNSSELTLIIDEFNGFEANEIYQASELYLTTKISSSVHQLKVSKSPRDKSLSVAINKGEKLTDFFQGISLVWEFTSTETQNTVVDFESFSQSTAKSEHKSVLLTFDRRYKDKVLNIYIPYVVERSNELKEENKVVKLYSFGYSGDSVNLDHPSTFDTLAMDPLMKKELMDDLDRFLNRKDFYRTVGKAWKRGYLLYGPPGTGKSSLIAAMANYLKFNIYDVELASMRCNSELRRLMTTTTNRSIIVIEDIDCSIELQDRQTIDFNSRESQLTLSGLLNFIDGLWSSCGDERIIVFTTNHKDKLDPALLRPGRMDMHIHMSYCTPSGFKILASNYLKIKNHNHPLFMEIEELVGEVEVTPAEVAEELMKGGNVDCVLEGLLGFLKKKKEKVRCEEEEGSQVAEDVKGDENGGKSGKLDEGCVNEKGKKQRKRARKGKGRIL